MNIEYRILWFEDNEEWLESIKGQIIEDLASLGFDLKIRQSKDGSELQSLMKRRDIDLLAIDYKLEGTTGDEILRQLREKDVLTECVFYSSNDLASLRQSVAEKHIDGVYCAAREEFRHKLLGVIKTTIKKSQELNAIRGLVMSATSEFDEHMEEIVASYHSAGEKEREKVRAKIRKLLSTSCLELCKALEKFDDRDIGELLELLDAKKVWRTLREMMKPRKGEAGVTGVWEKIGEYDAVMNFRNVLAHVKSQVNETTGETEMAETVQFKGQDFKLTDEHCGLLRRDLKAHGVNFLAVRKVLLGSK